MAISLNDVNKNYSEKSKQYELRSRTEKKEQTATPWQDFESTPDLLEVIAKREGGVTKRVSREEYKRTPSTLKDTRPPIIKRAIEKMNSKKQHYNDSTLSKAIKERASKCLAGIPKDLL